MTDDTAVEHTDPDDFLVALRKALRPETLARAGDLLAEVIAGVAELDRKGTLTLTLELAPMKNTDAVDVVARVKAKPPEPPAVGTVMWATEAGRLERNDPRQTRLDIHAVDVTADRREAR